MSTEELEQYESEMELALYREYRDVVGMFRYIVETERRFYLANEVHVGPAPHAAGSPLEVELRDAWVWDMYRPARFVSHVRVLTFRDVNVEEITHRDVNDPPPFLSTSE